MGFTIYQSCDASAPTLTGAVGSLVNLLDKCLVAGYGTQAGAGWTKPYTGTDKAVFKQGADSCGLYLRVQDDGPGVGGAREARVTGYEGMSSVDSGSNPFPLANTQTDLAVNAHVCHKSDSLGTGQNSWMLFADSRTFYLFSTNPLPTASNTQNGTQLGFGDFFSTDGGRSDPGRCMLAANGEETLAVVNQNYLTPFSQFVGVYSTWARTSAWPPVSPRPPGGFGGSTPIALLGEYFRAAGIDVPAAGRAYLNLSSPNPSFWMVPILVGDPTTKVVRGRLRGLYHWLHPAKTTIGTGDILVGTGESAGKSFCSISLSGSATAVIEISDTLETNL